MPSSFYDQIPCVIHLVRSLTPTRILDIGKGFGKYGFLAHEYAGIDLQKPLRSDKSIKDQSALLIDAVEADETLLLPHLKEFYHCIYASKIQDCYAHLPPYDLYLMIDIIEHLPMADGERVLRHFLEVMAGTVIVSTPRQFFQQHLLESAFEEHHSFWRPVDFREIDNKMDYQTFSAGRVYLLGNNGRRVRGFGSTPGAKLRRLARCVMNEAGL